MADSQAKIVLSAVDRTSAGFQSAQRNLQGLLGSANAIGARLGPLLGAVGLLGAGLSALSFGNIVKGVDALNDVKDATGASIENLSALEDIGARTGTSFETVTNALVKLNGVLKDADANSPAALALDAIGLSIKQLRDLDPAEALRQIAVALSGYADDGRKAQIAQELFGRSIREVAPLLADLAKQGQLNATVTTEQAEAAEKFNQQLAALEKSAVDVARAVAGPLVDGFNSFFSAVKGGDEDFTKLSEAAQLVLVPLQAIAVLGANVALVLGGLGREIGGVAAQAAALARLDFQAAGQIRTELILDGEQARKDLDAFERRVLGLGSKAAANPVDGLRAVRALDNAQLPRPSAPGVPGAPGKPKGGAASRVDQGQVALLRTELQRREQIIQSTLSNEQDILRFNETFIEQVYRSGNTSLESNFRAQDELRRRNVQEIRRAAEETIAAEQAFQRALPKPKDAAGQARNATETEGSETRIQGARAKVATAERELQQATDLALLQRPEQREQIAQEVERFNAGLQELVDGGRSRATELADIAVRTREAEKLLVEGGADPAVAQQRAQDFGRLLEQQRQFTLARDEFARISDRARDAEEALAIEQQNGSTGLLESERQVYALRTKELAQLDALIERTRALAQANPGNDAIADELRKLEISAARLKQVQDPTKLRFDAAAENIGDAIADGLSRAVVEGDKLKDIIASIDRQIVAIITQEVVTKPLAQSIAGFIKGAGGQGTGQNLLTQLFGIGNSGAASAQPATGTPLDAAGQTVRAGLDALRTFDAATAGSADVLGTLTQATTGSAAILGKLPELAAIPATTAMVTLAAAAQVAAAALLQVAAAGTVGAAGSSGVGLLNLGGLIGGGGGFGSGANFGNLDLGLFLEDGGYTGNKGAKEPAGIVHGKEFVFSAPAVQALGVDKLTQLHSAAKAGHLALPGFEAGGYVDPTAAGLPAQQGDTTNAATAILGRWLGVPDAPGYADILADTVRGGEAINVQGLGLGRASQATAEPGIAPEPGASQEQTVLAAALRTAERLASADDGQEADPLDDLVRYHTGGIAGLAPDEVPAVLRRGEEVLTQADPRHRNNATGDAMTQTNNFYVTGALTRETQEQLAAKVGRQARMAMARGTM